MGDKYHIGDLTVDTNANTVIRGNETISISPRTFNLLVTLAKRSPDVVSREELLETVWPDEFVNDETLSQRVRVLRKSLGDLEENPRYISAVRGWGYRVVAQVTRLEIPKEKIRSIAVLPLTNITGDPQLEYFADGMTEALISALAKIRTLKVISRTSVMSYKLTNKKVPQIARELGVDAIIEGTVLVTKEHVRVSAQLVHGATDEHFWAEIYDRDLGDVLAMHSEIAQAIAREISAVVTPEETEKLEKKHHVDPDVLEAYLKGQFFASKYTPADGERAIGYYKKAIELDDRFAEAHIALAATYGMHAIPTGNAFSISTQRQIMAMAKASAERALSIDENLADAYGVVALVLLFNDWDWQGTEKALDRAYKLEPNSMFIHIFRAMLAATIQDSEKVLDELRRAIELDPVNLAFLSVAAEMSYWVRAYSQAMTYISRALDLNPAFPRAHYILARVHEAQGRPEEMITGYEKAGTFTKRGAAAARRVLKESGISGYYQWALDVQLGAMGEQPVDGLQMPHREDEKAFFRARNFARLGDVDNAIKCLEQSYEERDCRMPLLKTWEWFDSLRSDARFQDIMRRVGIP